MRAQGVDRIEDVLGMASVREVRRLLEEMPDAVVTVGDPDGRIRWVSRRGTQASFGRDPSEITGQNRFDYVHPDDRARARRAHGRAATGDTVQYAFRAEAADGTWVPAVTVAWSEMVDRDRVVVSITAITPSDDDS